MWQAQLSLSYQLLRLNALFYAALLGSSCILCWRYELSWFCLPILVLLIFEYRRSYRYLASISGDFAIQPSLNQLYWRRQRWRVMRKPLFLRYWVVIHIKSLHSGKQCRLCLSCTHFSRSEWRSCCYYLHRINNNF